jgi:prolyl-tRNA synthetase
VPLRLESGPKVVAKGTVAPARRDTPGKAGKAFVPAAGIADAVTQALLDVHTRLYQRALAFRQANTYQPHDYAEFKQVMEKSWAISWWCGEPACEAAIQEDTQATTRCIPLEQPGGEGRCIRCGRPATEVAVFARAYSRVFSVRFQA